MLGDRNHIRYPYDNHLGSASLELNEKAEIISYEEYHPFGTTSYRSGRTETEVSLKRYKYVGKERDDETGLYYPESLGFYESKTFEDARKITKIFNFLFFGIMGRGIMLRGWGGL